MAKGGFTGAVPPRETSPEDYSGVWDIVEQYGEQKAGSWPFQPADCAPRSLRFDSARYSTLSRTPAVASNRRVFTFSCWVKRHQTGANHTLFGANTDPWFSFYFDSNDKLSLYYENSGSQYWTSNAVFRDPSAWYHTVLSVNTTRSTSDRVKFYVNGEELTFGSTGSLSQGHEFIVNSTVVHDIGNRSSENQLSLDGTIAWVHFIDGQALSPQEFGFFDGQGIWQPKRFTGDYSSGPVYTNFIDNQATGNIISDPTNKGPQKLFDGQLNTLANISGGYVEIDLSSFGFVADGNGVEIYNTEAGAYTSYQINGGTAVNWGGTPGWQSFGGAGAVNTIRVNYLSGGNVNIGAAIRINGQILVDASVGRNSFHLDFSDASSNAALGTDSSGNGNDWTVNNITAGGAHLYSSGLSIPEGGGFNASYPAGNGFDGDTSTFTLGANTSTSVRWTYNSSFNLSGAVEIYVSGASMSVTFDDGRTSVTAAANQYTQISSAVDFTWFNVYQGSGLRGNITAVKVGGTVLIDSTNSDNFVDSPVNGNEASTGAGGERRGNYATLNPLNKHNSSDTFSNGNLDFTGSSGGGLTESTIAMSSGKYYFEAVFSGGQGTAQFAGIRKPGARNYNDSYIYVGTGNKYTNGASGTSYGESLSNGDTIGTAFDATNGTLTFYKNGVSQGTAFTSISGTYSFFVGSFGSPPTFVVNFGQRPFAYPLSGFSPLATSFLPEPTIKRGDEAMDVVTYTGTNATNTKTLNFSPDLLWFKSRSDALSHQIFDFVRGSTKVLFSDSTAGEGTETDRLASFNADGFTLGADAANRVNGTGKTYAAWSWDAGDATTTIAAGSLNSSAYDQSQTWTNFGSGDAASPYRWEETFDGSDSTYGAIAPQGSALSLDLTSLSGGGLSYSSSVVITYNRNTAAPDLTVNGVAVGATADGTDRTHTISGSGLLTNIGGQTRTTAGSGDMGIKKIVVDGRQLVDSGVTVANVPSIATTVRARPETGFSIVSYTGTGSAALVGHSLGVAPSMIIVKNRDTARPWSVFHKSIPNMSSGYINLNFTNAFTGSYTGVWNGTDPTNSVFSVGTDTESNNSGDDFIAYCWAPVEGYSSFGSFIGSQNFPFVYCGFRPRFLLIKPYDLASGWQLYDSERNSFNPADDYLAPNEASAEVNSVNNNQFDFLSNGFVPRGVANSGSNYTGYNFLYAAFAEHPFASNARAR